MKVKLLMMFLFVLMFSFVSAESIGDNYERNETMQITNYCEAGVCTYVTLNSIEYPNGTVTYPDVNMTKNFQAYNFTFIPPIIGTYYFNTCGDSTINVCDRDSFTVTYNGESGNSSVHIILLIFFSALLIGFYKIQQSVNFDKWYASILSKYEGKNWFNATGATMLYFFIKNLFAIYYVLGLLIVLIVTDMVLTFNIVSLITIMENVAFIYTLGSMGVFFAILGMAQQFIVKIVDDLKNLSWGIVNE